MDFRKAMQDLLNENNGDLETFQLDTFAMDIFNHRAEIPKLYRYMPANYYSIRNLETKTIFLSEAGKMNGIFEGAGFCFKQGEEKAFNQLTDLLYMKSFSECYNNLLMWGTYAENYSGICVEYDLTNMKEELNYYCHLFPIVYQQKRFDSSFSSYKMLMQELENYKIAKMQNCSVDIHFMQNIYGIYLIKSPYWKYEQEWRFMVPKAYMEESYSEGGVYSEYDEECQFSINSPIIPFNYVSAVYLGPRIEQTIKQHIVDICKQTLKKPVFEMTMSLTEFDLEKCEL